jgi:LDH2 family malate/lactate/ureidoglycolate dehydrogenase
MAKSKPRRNGTRHRLEDLRRLATDLIASVGVPRDRAAALSGHLLWFDAIGAHSLGIASLPQWLKQLERGEFDRHTEGTWTQERPGTAVLDGRNGIPPLILARAALVAAEKARDVGLGLVRVTGVRSPGPAAPFAAELAIGPLVGLVLGPDGTWALGLPASEGPPLLYDNRLGGGAPRSAREGMEPVPAWFPLIPPDGWLVSAFVVPAFEPLPSFHERVAAVLASDQACRIDPAAWEAQRRDLRERGLDLPAASWNAIRRHAETHGVSWEPESSLR